VLLKGTVYQKKSFPSKESDTKLLQSVYFACEVSTISSCSNRICYWTIPKSRMKHAWELHAALKECLRTIVQQVTPRLPATMSQP